MSVMTDKNIEKILISYILKQKEDFDEILSHVSPDFFLFKPYQSLFHKFLAGDFDEIELFLFQEGVMEVDIEELFSFDSDKNHNELLTFYRNVFASRIIKERYDEIQDLNNFEEQMKVMEEVKETIAGYTNDLSGIVSPNDAMDTYLAKLQKTQTDFIENNGVVGISTGLDKLDELIYGMGSEDYILVAARPSMGKTSLALKMFLSAIRADKVSVFVSLETPLPDLIGRLIVQVNNDLELKHTIFGKDADLVNSTILEIVEFLRNKKIYIIDFQGDSLSDALNPTPELVSKKLKKIEKIEGTLDVVFWDHIGLLGSSKKNIPEGNLKMTAISRELKLMIRTFGCPFIILSQLNRDLEKRVDKRPKLSDLRDSGALEQDADKIIFVYRAFIYLMAEIKEKMKEKPDDPSFQREIDLLMGRDYTEAELIISKHRNGALGTIDACFHKASASFHDEIEDEIDLDAIYGQNPAIYSNEGA